MTLTEVRDLPGFFTYMRKGATNILRCVFFRAVWTRHNPLAKHRRSTCGGCDRVATFLGVPVACGVCGCLVKCLSRVPEYKCPHPDGPKFAAMTLEGEPLP